MSPQNDKSPDATITSKVAYCADDLILSNLLHRWNYIFLLAMTISPSFPSDHRRRSLLPIPHVRCSSK